jgi:hypothetical protein
LLFFSQPIARNLPDSKHDYGLEQHAVAVVRSFVFTRFFLCAVSVSVSVVDVSSSRELNPGAEKSE